MKCPHLSRLHPSPFTLDSKTWRHTHQGNCRAILSKPPSKEGSGERLGCGVHTGLSKSILKVFAGFGSDTTTVIWLTSQARVVSAGCAYRCQRHSQTKPSTAGVGPKWESVYVTVSQHSIRMQVHTRMHAHSHTVTYMHTRVHIHTWSHTCTLTYNHTHSLTHTHLHT